MIRFACPTCHKALSAPDEKAGLKLPCPGCGQRLQIPVPFASRTMLGELLPAGQAALPSPDPLWFYLHQGKQLGPVAKGALQKLSSLGQVGRDDLVWRQGMKNWAPFSAVPELRPAPAPVAPPKTPALTHPAGKKHPWLLPALLGGGLTALALLVGGLVAALLLWPRHESSPPAVVISAPPPREEPPPREPTTAEVVARSKPSVALVRTTMGSGTGFLAGPGLLVTNAHVIDGEMVSRIRVYFPSARGKKGPMPARLVYEDPKRDLAILAVDTPEKPLPVAEEFAFEGGEPIVVIGNPGATAGERIILENAVTQGVMSTRTKLDGLEFYQLSASVNPGNSGGPVLNARGEVIGVVTRKAVGRREEGLGFAVPLPDLKSALERARGREPREVARRAALHDFGVVRMPSRKQPTQR
jgi:S1-C subfamily serine protease